jgi:hypothetical protein
LAAGRVDAGGGFVEEQHLRPANQAGGEVDAAAHAAGVGLDLPVGRVVEVDVLQHLLGAGVGVAAGQAVEAADHGDVLPAGEVVVDGGELPGQADELTDRRRVAGDVVPGHSSRAGVRPQ